VAGVLPFRASFDPETMRQECNVRVPVASTDNAGICQVVGFGAIPGAKYPSAVVDAPDGVVCLRERNWDRVKGVATVVAQ